jgi:methylglutaconyl-CoA hydratase
MSGLRVERSGGVARVTLDRPEVRNAFNAELIAELHATFGALAAEAPADLRAVVLAGAGRSFCAGADIEWMRASLGLSLAENEADAGRMADMFAAIDACPVPVVARVQGAALGGGMGLCAVADVVVAPEDCLFGFTEAKLGILPAVIAPFVLAKIGESAARRFFVTAERFSAERAREMGLVHEVVADEAAVDEGVAAVLAEIGSAGPTAARVAKSTIRDLRRRSADEARALTVKRIAGQRTSAEGQEGLAAFLEKRRPAWHD